MTKKDTSTEKKGPGPLFNPGKAQWLQEKGTELDKDQQALLLAMAKLEAELGRELSEEEAAALEALSDQLEDSDSESITAAIHALVEKPADPKRKTSWPELKRYKPETASIEDGV